MSVHFDKATIKKIDAPLVPAFRLMQFLNLFFAHFDFFVDNSPGRELLSFRYIRNAENRLTG